MAILTVTSTADSGAGSLRQALIDAASGDIITFDDSLEVDGVVSIYLDSALSISQEITIDGGGHWLENGVLKTRVVLDRQQGANVILNYYNIASIKNLTLCNTTGGSAIRAITYDITIDYCVISNCASTNGGAVIAENNATINANNSLFTNCTAGNNGGACYQSNSSHFNFINCEFSNCSARNGGGVILYAINNTFASCKFNNNTGTVNGSDLYIVDDASVDIVDCLFLSTSGYSVYNKGAVTISGNATAYKFNTLSASTVTFSGVDSVLAVTTTATVNSATFTAAENSTGYLALPDGSPPPTVGTGVKTATYGAGIERASVSATVVSWTAETLSTPILIEQLSGDSWNTLTDSATGGTYSGTFGEGVTVRLFDGVNFYYASRPAPYWLVNSFAVNASNGWIVDASAVATNGGGGTDPVTGAPLPYWTITTDDITPNF